MKFNLSIKTAAHLAATVNAIVATNKICKTEGRRLAFTLSPAKEDAKILAFFEGLPREEQIAVLKGTITLNTVLLPLASADAEVAVDTEST